MAKAAKIMKLKQQRFLVDCREFIEITAGKKMEFQEVVEILLDDFSGVAEHNFDPYPEDGWRPRIMDYVLASFSNNSKGLTQEDKEQPGDDS